MPDRFAGENVYVTGFTSAFSKGTHHFFVSHNPDDIVEETSACYGDEAFVQFDASNVPDDLAHAQVDGAKYLGGSGEGAYETRMPGGYGKLLAQGEGFLVTNWHVLNVKPEPDDVFGIFNVYVASDVTYPVRPLNCLLMDVALEPHSTRSVGATCTVPFDLDLVTVASHAHLYLTRFEARLFDGNDTLPEPFYVSDDWDSPKITPLDEPMSLTTGQGITFTCHYRNDSDQVVGFGAGKYGEMCATMNDYAYPKSRPNEIPPPLGMVVVIDGGTAVLYDTTNLDTAF